MTRGEVFYTQDSLFEAANVFMTDAGSNATPQYIQESTEYGKQPNSFSPIPIQEELVVDNPLVGSVTLSKHVLIMNGAARIARLRHLTRSPQRQGQHPALTRFTPGRIS